MKSSKVFILMGGTMDVALRSLLKWIN